MHQQAVGLLVERRASGYVKIHGMTFNNNHREYENHEIFYFMISHQDRVLSRSPDVHCHASACKVSSLSTTMAASIRMGHGHGCANLPVRVPHLMPFHIQHTGPAPVSTYFRIKPHARPSSPIPDPSLPSGDSQTELTTATVNAKVVFLEEKEGLSAAEDAGRAVAGPVITATAEVDVVVANVKAPASPALQSGHIRRLSASAKRFISSFRGRTVHGVEVSLPKGYAGIVLRGDTDDRAHPRPSTGGKFKRRPVRNSRGRSAGEELDGISLEDGEEEPPAPVRVLKPTARFDSFVLWHPDIPVDEGRDEYLRSLSEWMDIASEVRAYVRLNVKCAVAIGLTMLYDTDSPKRGSSDIENVLCIVQWAVLYTASTTGLSFYSHYFVDLVACTIDRFVGPDSEVGSQ